MCELNVLVTFLEIRKKTFRILFHKWNFQLLLFSIRIDFAEVTWISKFASGYSIVTIQFRE